MSRLLRHVAQPAAILVAHRQFAGADRLGPLAFGAVTSGIARQIDPIRGLRQQTLLHAVIGFVVVRHDDRARRIHHVRVDQRGLIELVRRALEAEGIDVHLRAVDGERPDDAHLLVAGLDRGARIEDRVVAIYREDFLRTRRAVGLLHRRDVFPVDGIGAARRKDAAHEGMAVFMRLKRELLPERIGKAVVAGEPDLQRVRRSLGQVLLGPDLARLHRGFMYDHWMHRVVEVLQEDLPVGAKEHAEAAADDLELAGRRAIDHVVDRGARGPEIAREVGALRGEAGEDEAAIVLDARHRHHREARVAGCEAGALIAVPKRDGVERAIGLVGPAVVAAAEGLDVALAIADDLGAAMAAAVIDNMHGTIRVPAHDDGLAADGRRQIVARLRHLAVMPDIDPGAPEDALHFQLEQLRVDIDVAVNAIRLHKVPDRPAVIRHRYLLDAAAPLAPSTG